MSSAISQKAPFVEASTGMTRSERIKRWWASRPPEARKLTDARKIQNREGNLQRNALRTPEQIAEHNRRVSEGLKKSWAAIPVENRHRGDAESAKIRGQRCHDRHVRMTDAEKKKTYGLIGERVRTCAFNADSANAAARSARGRNARMSYLLRQTPEQKAATALKTHQTMLRKALAGELPARGCGAVAGAFASTKMHCTIPHESSYELKALQLFELDNAIAHFGRCNFTIPYKDANGVHRHYIPDFDVLYVDGRRAIIEIKPQNLLCDELNSRKLEAALAYCAVLPNTAFVVWCEAELGL